MVMNAVKYDMPSLRKCKLPEPTERLMQKCVANLQAEYEKLGEGEAFPFEDMAALVYMTVAIEAGAKVQEVPSPEKDRH